MNINEEKSDKKIKEVLISNIQKHIASSKGDNKDYQPATEATLLSITEHFIDQLAIKHFVGIQPMKGPVDVVNTLQYKEKENENENENVKSIEMIPLAVDARSRKYKVKIVPEHTECVTSETYKPCGHELAQEIYEEVKQDLLKISHKQNIDASTFMKNEKEITQEEIRMIFLHINYCANEIARKTRRGAGNFIIVSKTLANIISEGNEPIFKLDSSKAHHQYGYINYIGTIHSLIDVYCDNTFEDSKAIIGYKGRNGETDTGYYYCPYMPVMGDVLIDSSHFQPIIPLMMRYGKVDIRKETEETSNYFTEINFQNLPDYNFKQVKFIKEAIIEDKIKEDTKINSFEDAMKYIMDNKN